MAIVQGLCMAVGFAGVFVKRGLSVELLLVEKVHLLGIQVFVLALAVVLVVRVVQEVFLGDA